MIYHLPIGVQNECVFTTHQFYMTLSDNKHIFTTHPPPIYTLYMQQNILYTIYTYTLLHSIYHINI